MKTELIQQLKEYFEARNDVIMAFVFGSQAVGREHSGSDWDIGVYFVPISETLEWEEESREYPEEEHVWNDCISILKSDSVDLLVLNRAPATIADTAIRAIPLVIKDRALFLRFMLVVTQEAEDYRRFVDEYFAIHLRSSSLTSQDRASLERIIMFLNEQMSLYPDFKGLTGSEYKNNVHKRNDVERWIENMINAALDISKIILASQRKPVPDTYRESLFARHNLQARTPIQNVVAMIDAVKEFNGL